MNRVWTRILIGNLLVIVVAVGGYLWLVRSRFAPERLLVEHWRVRIASMSASEAAPYLQRITQFDTVGTDTLVELLAGQRADLAQLAGRMLQRQLEQWSGLPATESSSRVAHMARQLARQAREMTAPALTIAVALVRQILQWPITNDRTDSVQVVRDCQTVVDCWTRRAKQRSPSAAAGRQLAMRSANSTDAESHDVATVPPLVPSPLPGGGLPVNPVQLPPLPPSLVSPAPATPSAADAPHTLPILVHELPTEISPSTEHEPNHLPDDLLRDQQRALPSHSAPGLSPAPANHLQSPPDSTPLSRSSNVRKLADFTLVKQLADTDARVAFQATMELIRRGFTRTDLEFAQQFLDPNPETRLRLVAELEQLPIAKSRWLIWFSKDKDRRVRRAAATRMATAQDPALQRRLAEMATHETDSQLRADLLRWAQDATGRVRR